MVTALSLLPVMKFHSEPETGMVLQGIVHGRGFYEFPATLNAIPVIAILEGVRKGLDLTLKLSDPSGIIISTQTISLDKNLENDYGTCVFSPSAAIVSPGIYRFELFAGVNRLKSKSIQFVGASDQVYPVENAPELDALIIAERVTNRDNLELLSIERVMSERGITLGKQCTIVTTWDRVTKPFVVEFELVSPTGKVLDRRPFSVTTETHMGINATMFVDLPANVFQSVGTYILKAFYGDKASQFPIFITNAVTTRETRGAKHEEGKGMIQKRGKSSTKGKPKPVLDIYLNITEAIRSDDKIDFKISRLIDKPVGNSHFTVIDFRDNDMLVSLKIYVYLPVDIPITAIIWDIARKAAINIINTDPDLLNVVTQGTPLQDKPTSSYSRGIKHTKDIRFQSTTLAVIEDFETESTGIVNVRGLINTFLLPGTPFQVASLPILTTWMGVEEPFELTIKIVEPSGKVAGLASEKVESTNPWGYLRHVIAPEFLVSKPGIYSLELFAHNKRYLSKPIEFRMPSGKAFDIKHSPQLDMCLVTENVENVQSDHELVARNIMGDGGFMSGQPIGFLLGWSFCSRPFSVNYNILDTLMRPVMDPQTHNFAQETSKVGMERSIRRLHLGYGGFPFVVSGVYWLKLIYGTTTKLVPFYIRVP